MKFRLNEAMARSQDNGKKVSKKPVGYFPDQVKAHSKSI